MNAAKYQGYSFYRLLVFKGKPPGGGVKLAPTSPPPPPFTEIRVKYGSEYNDKDPKFKTGDRVRTSKYKKYKNFFLQKAILQIVLKKSF